MTEASTAQASPATTESTGPGVGRSVFIGCLIGVATSLIVITAGMRAAGVGWGSSIGLGLFIGCWGGIGFGGMMGGVAYLTKPDTVPTDAAAAPPTGAETARDTDGRAIPLPPVSPANATPPNTNADEEPTVDADHPAPVDADHHAPVNADQRAPAGAR